MNKIIRVLLLEDNPDDARLIEHELQKSELTIQIRRVETREEFISEVKSFNPDIILADYNLPDFSALEALRFLRQNRSSIPLILVTGSNSEEAVVQCMLEGAEDYILKYSLLRLNTAVDNALKKRRAIKEKERVLDALKKNEELYRLITENTHDLICLVDSEGYFFYASPSFKRKLGYSRSKLMGTSIFRLVRPDDRDRTIQQFHDSMQMKKPFESELRIMNTSSEWLYFQASGNWINHKNDTKEKLLLILRDITEKKQAEIELLKAKEEAEEATRQKSRFLSAMSHEIRTPLNVILGYTSLLKDIYSEMDDNQANLSYFTYIERAGKRLLNTITQILDISRIEAGEFPVTVEPVNLGDAARSVYDMLSIIAQEKNLQMRLNLPAEELMVLADEYCLNGILTNLVSNSIKYSNKGVIEIGIERSGKLVSVTISDEGIGMSEEYLQHLYESFRQENTSGKRKIEGSGLGLALTKKYIELINGKIEVKSIKDVGTTITVRLPAAVALYKT